MVHFLFSPFNSLQSRLKYYCSPVNTPHNASHQGTSFAIKQHNKHFVLLDKIALFRLFEMRLLLCQSALLRCSGVLDWAFFVFEFSALLEFWMVFVGKTWRNRRYGKASLLSLIV